MGGISQLQILDMGKKPMANFRHGGGNKPVANFRHGGNVQGEKAMGETATGKTVCGGIGHRWGESLGGK